MARSVQTITSHGLRSRWNDQEAARAADPLAARVYSARLLGQEPSLVLHGGGNVSVKAAAADPLGGSDELLYIKGSGADLADIERSGFAPVRLKPAQQLATLPELSDPDMVKRLRAAMTDPDAPTPSVETLLHAIIPFPFVDHTHADAVVAITNTQDGAARIKALYGDRVLLVPYVMPGFLLSKAVYQITRTTDWSTLQGIVLASHGVFTFGKDAKESYERMISLVVEAERYLDAHAEATPAARMSRGEADLRALATLRKAVSVTAGMPLLASWDREPEAVAFSARADAAAIATRGPLTPDHVIRTKRVPVIVSQDPAQDLARYASAYKSYFNKHAHAGLISVDPAPRWAVWPGQGLVAFGTTVKAAGIAADIVRHTTRAIERAEALGGWKALPERDIFDVEYWALEQAKIRQAGPRPMLQGKIAVVTGAASGIGRACVEALQRYGAVVAALDVNPNVTEHFARPGILGVTCDVTDRAAVAAAVEAAVRRFGGLDILISNAGTFSAGKTIAEMDAATWEKSLAVNLTSHQVLLQACQPYLALGVDPAVVIMGSKNVAAPGPGASAYSVAKAGLTQLARVAALEWAPLGIRVNVIHPNQVFDTGIWTPEVLAQRAKQYGMSVEEYKTSNLLRVEITSRDVAELACAMAGPAFAKTTGAQVPIDGGNDRVI